VSVCGEETSGEGRRPSGRELVDAYLSSAADERDVKTAMGRTMRR
jgi:hypothetical protein